MTVFQTLKAKAGWFLARLTADQLKQMWVDWRTPDSVHDGEKVETYIADLEDAGATVVNDPDRHGPILVEFRVDAETLLGRADGDYRPIKERTLPHDPTEITLEPK